MHDLIDKMWCLKHTKAAKSSVILTQILLSNSVSIEST